MHARRRHQVAQIIHLEIVPVLKRRGIGVAVAQPDEHGRVEVAVGALGLGDDADGSLDAPFQILVMGHGIRGAGAFNQLVEIAVVEQRTAVMTFGQAGGNFEVAEVLRIICAFHQPAHAGKHLRVAKLETVGPETVGPADLAGLGLFNLRKRA